MFYYSINTHTPCEGIDDTGLIELMIGPKQILFIIQTLIKLMILHSYDDISNILVWFS